MSKPSRERKTVDRLTTEAPESKGDDAVVIPAGSGTKLGEISSVQKALKKAGDDELKAVHSALYGKAGKAATRKKNINAFKGYAEGDEDGREEKLAANKHLKDIATALALSAKGTKADIASRVFEFLKSPSGDGASEAAPSKKRKAADSSGDKAATKKKKGGAPVRPNSAYIQFSNDKRAEVKEDNPDLDAKDVMRRLAEMWKELSGKEQDKYKAAAHKAWVAAGGPAAKEIHDKEKAAEKEEKKEAKKAEKAAEKAAGGEKKPAAKKASKKSKDKEEEEEEEEEEAAVEKEADEEEAKGEEDAAEGDDADANGDDAAAADEE